MIIFSRRVAIGGDVGVTYPEQCVLLNNYHLVNENYYLSIDCISILVYFLIFYCFPKIYLLIYQ